MSLCEVTESIPIDAFDEPLLLRHQEPQYSLLDLGEQRDGLLEVWWVFLQLFLEQIPERLVHDLFNLGLEGGLLLFRLQILIQFKINTVSMVRILANLAIKTRYKFTAYNYNSAMKSQHSSSNILY